jgi:hypothetical protein
MSTSTLNVAKIRCKYLGIFALLILLCPIAKLHAQGYTPPNGNNERVVNPNDHGWKITQTTPIITTSGYWGTSSPSMMNFSVPGYWEVDFIGRNYETVLSDTVTKSGPITFRFDWLGTPATVPTEVRILQSAGAMAQVMYKAPASGSFTADSGLPKPKITITDSVDVDGKVTKGKSVVSKALIVKKNPGVSFTVIGAPSASASPQAGTHQVTIPANPYYGYGSMGGTQTVIDRASALGPMIAYNAQIDDRKVWVIRGGRYEWHDADGVGHGHTTFSYKIKKTITSMFTQEYTNVINYPSFTYVKDGNWIRPNDFGHSVLNDDPAERAKWVAPNMITPEENPSCTIYAPMGNPYFDTSFTVNSFTEGNVWRGTPSNSMSHLITYTLTDLNDDAVSIGKYELTYHDAIEALTDTVTGEIKEYQASPRSMHIGPLSPPIDEEYNVSLGGSWGYGISNAEIAKWFPVFSLTYTTVPEVRVRHAVWQETDGPVPAGEFLDLYIREGWNKHTLKYYEYDTLGQIRADSNDKSVKTTSIGKQLMDATYYWVKKSYANGF